MTNRELQWRLIYACVVAGKSARFADGVMGRLFRIGESPFTAIAEYEKSSQGLEGNLRTARSGNYKKLAKCLAVMIRAHLDLDRCTPEDLEQIHGIGPKTSRFFILWTRPEAESRYAALDTHVLKWLRYLGHSVPKSTPPGRKYAEIERIFLKECDSRGMTARAADSMIWEWCSARNHVDGDWPGSLRRTIAA